MMVFRAVCIYLLFWLLTSEESPVPAAAVDSVPSYADRLGQIVSIPLGLYIAFPSLVPTSQFWLGTESTDFHQRSGAAIASTAPTAHPSSFVVFSARVDLTTCCLSHAHIKHTILSGVKR